MNESEPISVLAQGVDFDPTPERPPGFEAADTVMNYVMWGCYAVAFIGLLLIGAMFVVSHRRGQASEHAGSLGVWGFGMLIIGGASGLFAALV